MLYSLRLLLVAKLIYRDMEGHEELQSLFG